MSILRVGHIGVVMAIVYCTGFGLQAGSWHLQRADGGVNAPRPVFLSRELFGDLSTVAANALTYWGLCAASCSSDEDSHAASPDHVDG